MNLSFPQQNPPAAASQAGECSGRSLPARIWNRLARSRIFISALLVLGALICVAVAAPLLSSQYGPVQAAPEFKGAALPGAGDQVRAVLGRTFYAARGSVLFNLFTACSALLAGISLGVLAGRRGGALDAALARLAELIETFPDFLFLIVLTLALRRTFPASSTGGLLLWAALTLVYSLNIARLARRHTRQIGQAAFVLAARNLGLAERRIFVRHVLPGVLLQMLPGAFFQLQAIVVAETVLSYLGLGLPRAAPSAAFFSASWGSMLFEGQQVVIEQPLALLIPGACLALLLLSLTGLGSRLQRVVE